MASIEQLLSIVARLRDPEGGCPWDLEQDFRSIASHTLEEAYEVEHAIAVDDMQLLREELGDLLLQVAFHARMAEESRLFAFDDVVDAICDKLVRRHPHVFGDARIATAQEQTHAWEQMKAQERARGKEGADPFGGVPPALPALARATKLIRRAARAGCDDGKRSSEEQRERIAEELERAESQKTRSDEAARAIGEALFALARLANGRGIDPEQALRDQIRAYEARARRRAAAGVAECDARSSGS